MYVDKDIKDYVKVKECRCKYLFSYFDVEYFLLDFFYLCCDNCFVFCKCGLEDCKLFCYLLLVVEELNDVLYQECNVLFEENKKK